MDDSQQRAAVGLDVTGLILAGLINTFLAAADAGLVLGPGTAVGQPDVQQRITWIAAHPWRWQAGWLFWFAVTLSFSWSFYALGRHLRYPWGWPALAVGTAVIAAAVDIVGVLVHMIILPQLALAAAGGEADLQIIFAAMEELANGLTNVAAYGLYSLAGLLLLPAVFATTGYPRWLVWLGVSEWAIAGLATLLLIVAPAAATGPLLISFALFAPWAWGNAVWLLNFR